MDTIKNAAHQNTPLDDLLNNLKNIHVELIFTEHPTDPLSKHANHALSNINNTIKADLENYIEELWNNPLTPSSKRSVMEEIDRDLIMLQKVFNIYPQFIKHVREAIKIYYPTAPADQLMTLDNIMVTKLGNKFLQGGGWAGFDADGNDEARPDLTLYALLKRRTTSMEQYIIYIKDNVLIHLDSVKDHIIIEEYNNLINAIKDKKLNLEQQINRLESHIYDVINYVEHFEVVSKIEQECKGYYLTSKLLLSA